MELGDAIDADVNARVRALDRAVTSDPPAGVVETAPTHRSLLVVYDRGVTNRAGLANALLERLGGSLETPEPREPHLVPVLYGGDDGPDLARIASEAGLTEAEAVRLHAGCEYTAYMVGFSPGFAYLGDVDPRLAMPRRGTPRVSVARGSVAIAGRLTAVYPSASPGGWNLIGRTSVPIFDPERQVPGLILPGDRVRFRVVDTLPEPLIAMPAAPTEHPVLEVVDGGFLTTVQDLGRIGYRRLGVTPSGPMDAAAHRAANALVGNPVDAATLECTMMGPELRFLAGTAFAVTGADLGATLERSDLGSWDVPRGRRVLARTGNVLTFRGRRTGCRAYIAFAGGVEARIVLGSRSTDLANGFGGHGGRSLRAGDRLGLARTTAKPTMESWSSPPPDSAVTVRVVLGPQLEAFEVEAVRRFLRSDYALTLASDRVGCRLEGAPLHHAGRPEFVTDGMVPGSIEVPPMGQPIVMMADAPTTGGYPKIATVLTDDLPLLAQLVPGDGRVRFQAVELSG